MLKKVLYVLCVLLVLSAPLAAQEETEPERRDPLGTRLVNVATPFPVQAKTLEVIFLHRFHLPVQDGSSSDLWGLDSGADVGIGLAFGITPRLDASLLRFSFQQDFELASKFLVLEQGPRRPLSVAVRAGVDRLELEGIEDPTRPFAQVLLSRRLGRGFNLLMSPSWVRDTPRLRNAFNVPVGLTFALRGGSLVELEVIPENRDLDESVTAWHLAWSRDVGGHIFEIVLGNSRAVTVDQYLGGDSAAGFETEDVRLGFNLIRDFDFSF
ncbi:MAG: hypothetical protein QOH06_1456 [Acidobacteriota bacterium]|jgi:hypothetical protein|nr:hypothetical protein [Acidobacteriota bacterium]